tara:strand:- start:1641 stop:1991 length:351 start_codon:yes stop_codon:yes gene_type:complete
MYQITSEVYLDLYNECYKNILVIYPKPKDPSLNAITKPITREKLSPFDDISPCCPRDRCMYAVVHPYNKCELLCVNDIALLFSYLNENSYNINTDVTKIMLKSSVQIKNLICFISK